MTTPPHVRTLAVTLVLSALAAPALGVEANGFRPAAPADIARELVASEGGGAATGLDATARCSETEPRTAIIELRWLAPDGARRQRVSVTSLRDGFATGRFDSSTELRASTSTATLVATEPGLRYYWHVLVEDAAGDWVASATARFDVPTCPWDGAPEWAE